VPKITVSKEQISGFPVAPEGVYEVRLDSFRPAKVGAKAKDQNSVNLKPALKIVNSQDFNDQFAGWENLNTGCWYLVDFAHCFGEPMIDVGGGNISLPGEFIGPDDDPSKWQYVGPLAGKVGKVYLKVGKDQNNKDCNVIDHYFCALPGCQEKHSAHLVK
jgi:hypothetical protein